MTERAPDNETIRVIARAAGIEIPDDDLPALAAAFANELGGIAALEELDLEGVEPIVSFDPHWK